MEIPQHDQCSLIPLTIGMNVEPCAHNLLSELFVMQMRTKDRWVQFRPTKAVAEGVLLRQPTRDQLRRIRTYASRPVFDSQFRWCPPGYHADEGILVHGPEVHVSEHMA